MDDLKSMPPTLEYRAPTEHERRAVGGLQLLGAFVTLIGLLPLVILVLHEGWDGLLRSVRDAPLFWVVVGCGLFKVAMSFLVKRRVAWAGIAALALVGLELGLWVVMLLFQLDRPGVVMALCIGVPVITGWSAVMVEMWLAIKEYP